MPPVSAFRSVLILLLIIVFALPSYAEVTSVQTREKHEAGKQPDGEYSLEKVVKSDKEWRKQLSRKQFDVTRRGATERPRTGKYWRHKAEGTYTCVCCELPLFSSKTKYKSGTGWPSFFAPVNRKHVSQHLDRSLFNVRTEIRCARCDAHLGHVFSDGPRPTGLRYCMNSAALDFEPVDKSPKKSVDKQQEQQLSPAASDEDDS